MAPPSQFNNGALVLETRKTCTVAMEAPHMETGIGDRDGISAKTRDPTLEAPNEEGIISGADGKKYLSPLQKMSLGLLGFKVESLSERMVRKDLYKTATGAVDSPEYMDKVLANLHQERARSLAFFDTVDRVSHASVERMRNLLFPVKKAKTAKKRWFGKTLLAICHPGCSIVPKEYDSAVILPLVDWKHKMWKDSSQRRMAEGERLSQERAATEAWYDELIQGWNNDRAVAVSNRKILAEATLVGQERSTVEPKEPTIMGERLTATNRYRGERKVKQDKRAVEPKLHTTDARLAVFDRLGASDLARGPCKADKEKGWVESKAPPASDAGLLDQLWASDPLLAELGIKRTRLIPRQDYLASPAQAEIVKGDVQAQQSNLMEDFKADIKRALERGTQRAPGGKKRPINVTVLDLSQRTEKVEEADGPSNRNIDRLEEHVAFKTNWVAVAGPEAAASDEPLRGGEPMAAEKESLHQYAHLFSETDEMLVSNNRGPVHEPEQHLMAEDEDFLEQDPHLLEWNQALSGSNWDALHDPGQHLLATPTEMGGLMEQNDAMFEENLNEATHLIDGYTAQSSPNGTMSEMPMVQEGTTARGRTNGNKAIYQDFSQQHHDQSPELVLPPAPQLPALGPTYTPKDDAILIELAQYDDLSWKERTNFVSGRSRESVRTRYRYTLEGKKRLKGSKILLSNGSASQRSHPSAQTQKTQSQGGLHAQAQEMKNNIRAEQQQDVLDAQEQMRMNMRMRNPDLVPAHQRVFARRTQQGNLPDSSLLMDNIAQQPLPAPPVEQWTQFQINMRQQPQPQARIQGQRDGDLEAHGQQALCSRDLSPACAGLCEGLLEHAEGMKEEWHGPALVGLSASHASSTTMGESLARFWKRRILVLGQTGPIRWDLLPATEFGTIREILGSDWNLAEQERCMDGWLRKQASTVLGNLTPPAPLPNEKDLDYILNMLGSSSHQISADSEHKALPPHSLSLPVHDLQDYGHRNKATFQFVNEHIYDPVAGMDVLGSEPSNSSSLQLAMREKKLDDEYDDKGWGYINADGYIAGCVGMTAPNRPQRQANYHLPSSLASAEYRRQVDYHNPLVSRLPKLKCSTVDQEPDCHVISDTLSCIYCKCEDDNCNCELTTDTPGLHTSAFIRNIRRCARFVGDVVRHDHVWLYQGYPHDYTSSSSECLEAKFDDDCAKCCSRNSASLLEPSKLPGWGWGGRLAAEFSLKLAEQPNAGAKVAAWEANAANAGGGTFSFSHLLQTRPETSDTDDSTYFLRAWNVRAMTMGWWHSKRLKGKEPPKALLPPHLHDLHLEPPFQEEVEQEVLPDWRLDKWSMGRCLVYLQDPYDTVDWRIRQADMSQKRRREQDIQEATERKTLVKVSWFGTKDHVPKRHKRMEPTPPVSAAGLRGGCLDADSGGLHQEHHTPSTTRKRRRTLLDSDPVYQSSKRKWTGQQSFISNGPPQTVHPPRAKRQNIDTTPRYFQRAQSPVPNPPPSPPGTPPPRPAKVTAARPHWCVPFQSELGQRTDKRPDAITLNLDFIPLDLPRTGDLKKFSELNAQTLGVTGRTIVKQRLRVEEICSEWHGFGRARRDSGFVEMPDAIESIFTDCPQSCRAGRRDSAVVVDEEEEEEDTVMHG